MRDTHPTLADFLDTKPLYYKEIDRERIHIAYGIIKPHIKRPITIHIVGTNGKGSTGRMIAHLAYAYSAERLALSVEKTSTRLSVGHYTSPHILRFNERIWLNGSDASDEILEDAHERLYGILGQEVSDGLSYFEYTTLLAFVVFENCDLMVLEAGLGGEFDATNVCDKELSVITPIGIDHQAFLGETIEEIAATKIRSIQKKALIAPQPYLEVVEVAQKIADTVGAVLRVCPSPDNRINTSRVNTRVDPYALEKIAREKSWPPFLLQNARVAMAALEILGIPYDVSDLESLELFGRFYPWRENICIDVGHNPLAARAIVDAMEPGTVLIYNSLDDKDYDEVLRVLQPKLKRIEIIPIDSQRAATAEAIEAAVRRMGFSYQYFDGTIEPDEHYLVFGSFYVVEAFLRNVENT
jgi:dihydrofolate synthase/folylpolyglutamate synthase